MTKYLSLFIVGAYGAAVTASFFINTDISKKEGKRVFIQDTASLRAAIIGSVENLFPGKDTLVIDFTADYVCGNRTEEEIAIDKEEYERFPVRYTDFRLLDSFYRKEFSKILGVVVMTSNDLFWLRMSQVSDRFDNKHESLHVEEKYIDSLNANIVFLTFDATALGSKNVMVTQRYKVGKSFTEIPQNFKYRGSKWVVSK